MNILITGASRGVGAALAREFASRNVKNIYLTSRNKNALDKLKKGIEEEFTEVKVHSFPHDLNNYEEIDVLAAEISKVSDTLDVIINNAATLVKGSFTEIDAEKIEHSFKVNYIAPALLIRKLIPLLKRSEHAHVVNIGSMAGYLGSVKFPGLSHYGASKAALSSLSESLAVEYADEKISFNTIAMGSVQTEMLEEAFPGIQAPVKPSEMAVFLADFALKACKYMNGKVLPVSLSTP